jgi:acetyl-CoA carboxylase carboxyltransferase component
MASLIQNLFKSRQRRDSDVRKTAVDNRKNLGNDYSQNVLRKSMSAYIFRNNTMNDFVILIQKTFSDLINAVAYLKGFKSYTTKK